MNSFGNLNFQTFSNSPMRVPERGNKDQSAEVVEPIIEDNYGSDHEKLLDNQSEDEYSLPDTSPKGGRDQSPDEFSHRLLQSRNNNFPPESKTDPQTVQKDRP